MGRSVSRSARVRSCLVVSASIAALAVSHNAQAQALCPNGQPGPVCVINNSGSSGPVVGTNGNVTILNNTGTVTGAPAVNMGGSSVLFLNNEASGVITGTSGVAITGVPRLVFGVDNSGTINGNVVFNDAPAPNPFTSGPTYFISDGGTVNGNVQLGTSGFSFSNFIQRGADDGVTGSITAGAGMDIYTRSYTTSQLLALGARPLPATFEIEGFEVLGVGTTVTLAGAGTSVNFMGNGNVVNTGTLSPVSTAGLYPVGVEVIAPAIGYFQTQVATFRRFQVPAGQPASFFTQTFGNALTSFTNAATGVITGDLTLSTASFTNAGDINLYTRSAGSVVHGAANSAFVFDNSGNIEMVVNGARLGSIVDEFDDGREAALRLRSAINTTAAADVTVRNSGSIIGGLNARMAAEDFVFENTGSIEGIDIPGGYYTPGLVLWVGELNLVAGADPESHFDAATATFVNAATGSIDHNVEAYFSSFNVSFTNRGFIASSDVNPGALYLEQYLDADDVDATSLQFVNSGMFEGNVSLESETTTVSIQNSGTIEGQEYAITGANFEDAIFGGESAFEIDNETSGDQTLTFVNSGTVANTGHAGSAVTIEVDAGDEDDETGAETPGSVNLGVVNSGTISATGGGTTVSREYAPFLAEGQYLANPLAALAIDAADVTGASVVSVTNQEGGVIRAGGNVHAVTPQGYTDTGSPGEFTVALIVKGKTVDIVNSGLIEGGGGTILVGGAVIEDADLEGQFLAGAIHTVGGEQGLDEIYVSSVDTLTNTATGVIVGSIDLGGNNDTITNAGSIDGWTYLGGGDDALSNYGTYAGNVFFGAGNDTFTHGINAIFSGIADGEDGEDRFVLDATGGGTIDGSIYDRLVNFEILTTVGQGEVNVDLGGGDDSFENEGTINEVDLGSGDNTFANAGTVEGDVTGGAGDDQVANDGQIEGGVVLGDGENVFANTGTVTGDVAGGASADTVENEGTIEGSVDLGDGENAFVNEGTVNGDVEGGTGGDEVANAGEVNGNIDLGAGDNEFANTGEVTGDVSSGTGDDEVVNTGTVNGNLYLDDSGTVTQGIFAGLRLADLDGRLTTQALSTQAITTLDTHDGGNDEFTNTGTFNGSVFAGSGNDVVTNSGTITGDVDLGEGNDTLELLGAWAIGGSVTGGAGTDLLDLTLAGTEPQVLGLSRFTSFENLELSGGTGIIQGAASFGQINLPSGRLIGAAGSHITANVAVASGATFGSAGRVTGNIAVASGGTLSPGASPGVMTVVGNVSLANGSTTLFEFVPAPGQSDQLLVDGTLTIASGARLNLTGSRPLTPGVAYDMIIADAIVGQFTIGTWNQSQVQGFLRYVDGTADDRLQLLGTFVFQSAANPGADAAMTYVNSLLVNGSASPALLGSISSLLDANGFASTAAFSQLTPEAYASATQLGVENGLSLAKVSRSGIAEAPGAKGGLFAFGTAFGTWRSLDADTALGTSQAKNRDYGVIGGLGFGSEAASLGGFVGYVDGRQRISALASQTESDGMVAGLTGHYGVAGFDLNALVAYDWSEADTLRGVPGGSVSSSYDLESLVLDAGASYDLAMGGFTLTPGAGITHISVKRGAASEVGSAAFGLDVDRDKHAATFVDGSLGFGLAPGAALRPWAEVGVRHQLEGDRVFASAGLLGSATRFAVPGAPRDDTVLTAGAGVEADVAGNVSVSASYRGEFGGGTGTTAALGLKAKF